MGSDGREQFQQFTVSRWPALARLAYGLTGDRWAAENLAQIALASAYAAWSRVRRADDPDAYVRKILISAWNGRFRRRQAAAEVQVLEEAGQEPASDPAGAIGERPAPLAALAGLPPRQRAVIVLRYWAGMTDAQVAAMLGRPEITVRSQAARALAKLRSSAGLTVAELADGEPRGKSQAWEGGAPVSAIIHRGQAKRSARRWAFTGGVALVAVVAAAAALLQPGPATRRHTVTLNKPDPRAPGGVFASGTADGKPWRLAVRNVAGLTGWCLPAVMLNGRDGDVLFRPASPAIVNPAFVTDPPGFPGIEFVVAAVSPNVTTAALDTGSGRFANTPITVTECGKRFHMAGWALRTARRRLPVIETYSATSGLDEGQVVAQQSQGPFAQGLWQNMDEMGTDVAASAKTSTIASGAVGNASWKIQVSLGLFGECYTGATTTNYGPGQAQECQPVEEPAGLSLSTVPFPANTSAQLSGYAGPVSPRTARAVVRLSDGTTETLTPVAFSGRKYLALTVTGQVRVTRVTLLDAAGHDFATTSAVPATK